MSTSMVFLFVLLCAADASPFGQVFTAYFSGVSPDTVGAGGVNSLALAFFDPAAMAKTACDFTDLSTPCLTISYSYALSTISQTSAGLSGNTSPQRGGKPVIFFSFGGESQGGAAWDNIFASSESAALFGQNCGKLVNQVSHR